MLRYYRFILPRSRNLVLIKKNVVERNANYSIIQSFRFASSNTVQSDKHLPRNYYPVHYIKLDDEQFNAEIAEIEHSIFCNDWFDDVNRLILESELVSADIAESEPETWFGCNQKTTFVNKDVLIHLLDRGDFNAIRKELSEKFWPLLTSKTRSMIHDTFRAFIASATTAEDIDEIVLMLKDFSKQQPLAFLNQKVLFDLIKKSAEIPKPEKPVESQIYGPKKVLEVITQIHSYFPPGARQFSRSQLLSLFESLFNHTETDFMSASKVCNELINVGLMADRRIFLEVAANFLISKLKYDDAYYYWSSACSYDNVVSGGNVFLEYVLSNKKMSIKLQEKRIKQLVQFYERILSPSDVIAQLIVSLVSTGRIPDAKVLWLKTDIDLKHFLGPVYKLKNDQFVDVNLIHIRDFAHLLEECVLAEFTSKKKSLKKKKKKNVDSEATTSDDTNAEPESEEIPDVPDGNMAFLLKKWRPFKKRKYVKEKIKRFDVRADQLEALVNAIQEVWVYLIEEKDDPKLAGPKEFNKFLARNHIPLNESLHERVEMLKKRVLKKQENE